MKRNLVIISSSVAVVAGVSAIVITTLTSGLQSQTVNCVDVLKKHATKLEQTTVTPNPDNGLFVVSDGNEPGQLVFLGYVGPKSVELMRNQMLNAGLKKISINVEGTCEIENGLVYTLVSGSYVVPEQKPDPI